MQYKTMVLELLQQHPEIYNQLRSERMLLPMLELYASQLKASHEIWQERLAQARPNSDQSQIASEALEIAVQKLEDYLTSGVSPNDSDPLPLDAAMAFMLGPRSRA